MNQQASGCLSPNTALLIKADALFGWYLFALLPLPPVPPTLPRQDEEEDILDFPVPVFLVGAAYSNTEPPPRGPGPSIHFCC